MYIINKEMAEALSRLIELLDNNPAVFLDGTIDIPGEFRVEKFVDGTWGIDLSNPTR